MPRLALLIALASSAAYGQVPAGFKPLFNGKDLRGWHVSRTNHHGTTLDARVEDGTLVLEQSPIGEGGILLTDRRYRDFELYLEVKPDWGCDGGIFLRSNEEGNAYQITIDYMPRNTVGAFITEGIPAITGTGPRRPADWTKFWKRDEWNTFRVRMTGEAPHVTIWTNGEQVVDFTDAENHAIAGRDGMIALQLHFTNASTPRSIPHGVHRYRNIAIRELAAAARSSAPPERRAPVTTSPLGMEFVLIPAGTFTMGRFAPACAPAGHQDNVTEAQRAECLKMAEAAALPGFRAGIPQPFYIGKYEVTQEQYAKVMGRNPSRFPAPNHPVDGVSWEDAQAFIQKLNALEKTRVYRLPTAVEWEYAARAGTADEFQGAKRAEVAWSMSNSKFTTHPVGALMPNSWGIYDMLGNVWEWVQDWYDERVQPAGPGGPPSGKVHVLRGGAYTSHDKNVRVSVHAGGPGSGNTGFRVVKEAR